MKAANFAYIWLNKIASLCSHKTSTWKFQILSQKQASLKKTSQKFQVKNCFKHKASRNLNKKHRSLNILWSKSTLGKTYRKHAEKSFKIRKILLILVRDTGSKLTYDISLKKCYLLISRPVAFMILTRSLSWTNKTKLCVITTRSTLGNVITSNLPWRTIILSIQPLHSNLTDWAGIHFLNHDLIFGFPNG